MASRYTVSAIIAFVCILLYVVISNKQLRLLKDNAATDIQRIQDSMNGVNRHLASNLDKLIDSLRNIKSDSVYILKIDTIYRVDSTIIKKQINLINTYAKRVDTQLYQIINLEKQFNDHKRLHTKDSIELLKKNQRIRSLEDTLQSCIRTQLNMQENKRGFLDWLINTNK